jgi:hypothetical protein
MSPNEQFDELILDARERDSNASIDHIVDMTRIARTTVLNILTNRLGFILRQYRFVLHVLSDTLPADRLAKSIELLQVLMQEGKTNW